MLNTRDQLPDKIVIPPPIMHYHNYWQKCIVVYRREVKTIGGKIKLLPWEYLICNGSNMGKWTGQFGATCLADTADCKEFARNIFSCAISVDSKYEYASTNAEIKYKIPHD